jgi:uncharacterized protein (TIGR02594 family)
MIPKWIEIAVRELGQHEIAGAGANAHIAEFLTSVGQAGDDEIPWCAAFVNWCLAQAGELGTGKALAKSYMNWGVHCDPQIGAVAVMDRGIDPNMGHVAFVLDYQPDVDFVYLIGGNQGNRVGINLKHAEIIKDFRWPVKT